MPQPSTPSGMSWPLKPMALRDAAPTFDQHLFKRRDGWMESRQRWFRPEPWNAVASSPVLVATWDFQAQDGPLYGHAIGPATIYVLPVPTELRSDINAACLQHGLPALTNWLATGLAHGDGWKVTPHRAEWLWPNAELRISA